MKKYTPFLLVLMTTFALIGVEACGPTQPIQVSNPIAINPKNDPKNPIAVYKNEVATTFKKAFKGIFDKAQGNTVQDKLRNALVDFEKLAQQGTVFKPQAVTGYYYNDPIPVLLSDPYWHVVNMPTPKSERLILKEGKARYLDNKYWGKKVTMTVQPNIPSLTKYLFKKNGFDKKMLEKDRIEPRNKTDFNIDSLDFDVEVTVVGAVSSNGNTDSGQVIPRYYSFRNLFLRPKLPYIKERFALLYSGGNIEAEAHARFWNDLKFMYKTLVHKRQIDPKNIIVIYKDGFQEANDTLYKTEIPVHFRAETAAIDSAIAQLRVKMSAVRDAELFVYMTNHGGQMTDYDHDELVGDGTDESIFLYGLVDDQLTAEADDTWRDRLKILPYKRLIAVIEPCFGGGLLRDLGTMSNPTMAKEHIIITSTTEDKVSYGERPAGFDIFSYFFTSALAGKYPDGRPVNMLSTPPPFSLFKAFTFARDSAYHHSDNRQTSLLDDNKDGRYERNPTASKRDSSLANSKF